MELALKNGYVSTSCRKCFEYGGDGEEPTPSRRPDILLTRVYFRGCEGSRENKTLPKWRNHFVVC